MRKLTILAMLMISVVNAQTFNFECNTRTETITVNYQRVTTTYPNGRIFPNIETLEQTVLDYRNVMINTYTDQDVLTSSVTGTILHNQASSTIANPNYNEIYNRPGTITFNNDVNVDESALPYTMEEMWIRFLNDYTKYTGDVLDTSEMTIIFNWEYNSGSVFAGSALFGCNDQLAVLNLNYYSLENLSDTNKEFEMWKTFYHELGHDIFNLAHPQGEDGSFDVGYYDADRNPTAIIMSSGGHGARVFEDRGEITNRFFNQDIELASTPSDCTYAQSRDN